MTESLSSQVASIKQLPPAKQRQAAAIIGALVADAAAKPLHWIYKQDVLGGILAGVDGAPEFFPKSRCPYYTTPTGMLSTYGEICRATLNVMCRNNNSADVREVAQEYVKKFGAGTVYEEALNKRNKAMGKSKKDEKIDGPIEGPWMHISVAKLLEKLNDNAELVGEAEWDKNDGFCAVLPIIAKKCADEPDVWNAKALPVARMLTTNAMALKIYHALAVILQAFLTKQKQPFEHAMQFIDAEVLEMMKEVEDSHNVKPYIETVAGFGKSCHNPGSFKGAYLTMLSTHSYVEGVRTSITAGGCNCSRANIVGAFYAAKDGIDAIPIEWMQKVTCIEEILQKVITVIEK